MTYKQFIPLAVVVAAFAMTPLVTQAASYQFTSSLYYGMENSTDVVELQNFLIAQGYLQNSTATGNYLSLTQAAVKAFQTANGIPSTGYFGPLSIAAANAIGNVAIGPAATVNATDDSASSDMGASAILSTSHTVHWQTANYPAGAQVNVNLLKKISGEHVSYTLVRTLASSVANTGSLVWTPKSGETAGNNLYVEVTCATGTKIACSAGQPISAF